MTIIYIYLRHGTKEYRNGHAPPGKPQHDPGLALTCIKICKEIGSTLLENYGIPSMIIMSPYLRTRQTASLLTENEPSFVEKRKFFYIDNNIAEFLGNQRGLIDISAETHVQSGGKLPPTGESMDELKRRVILHLKTMQILQEEGKVGFEKNTKSADDNLSTGSYKIVWVITHGLVISKVYSILKEVGFTGCEEEEFYPQELEGLMVRVSEKLRSVTVIRPITELD